MNDLIIPADFLEQAQITGPDLRLEVAVYLYDKQRLTMGQARKLSELDLISFQKELAKRGIFIKYDIEDLHADIDALHIDLNDRR